METPCIRVGSNWKNQPEAELDSELIATLAVETPLKQAQSGKVVCNVLLISDNQSSNAPHNLPRKKRICPSRACRNAKRLQAFLDRKVPLVHHAPQKVLKYVSQESSKVCLS